MQEVIKFLKEVGTFYIATVEGDQPRVRPFGAVAEFEGKLYICTNNKKPIFQQMKSNPKIEISGTDSKMNWIRIQAKAIVDPRREAKEAMLEQYEALKGMYSLDDGIFEVLYLEDGIATFSSMKDAPREVKF